MKGIKRIAAVATLLVAPNLLVIPWATAQNAVTNWNNVAITAARASDPTKTLGPGTPGGASIYVAYMQLAVYNAVNAIDGRFEPYKYSLTAPAGSSADAAAIEAAYRTLLSLLPNQKTYLDAQYGDHLIGMPSIPDGPAKTDGTSVGLASATALLGLRANDGLGGANVPPYTPPSGPVPGVWIPTPPALAAAQTPWVGQMRPFTFDDPGQFLPEPPPDLGSNTWADDYNEVKLLGAANSTVRTPQQTDIGLFWTDHTTAQYGRLLRSTGAGMSLADAARFFAMAYAASADGIIGCYNAKYYYNFWRPITAIRNGDIDANPDTVADPNWSPLLATPNHPEYPSAHSCLTGALAETLKEYFGTPNLHISIDSTVAGITNKVHSYKNVHEWQTEVELARIYTGFHYHQSVVQGGLLGRKVAHHMMGNYFRPVR